MSGKQGQQQQESSGGGYMDGVMVKISEQYKPPPRINLPVSYSQRLLLNKQLQEDMGRYEFALEKTVKDRMEEWKSARAALSDELKRKLDRIKGARSGPLENPTDENEGENNEQEQEYMVPRSTDVLIPTLANCTDVLKPVPLSDLNSTPYICKPADKSPFNISDFEADTSSPFDNVELKTINEMAELALVLQTKDNKNVSAAQQYTYLSAGTNSFPYVNYNNQRDPNQYSYSQLPPPTTTTSAAYALQQPTNSDQANGGYHYSSPAFHRAVYVSPYVYGGKHTSPPDSTTDENKLPFRSIPDIMKALETDLNHTHLSNRTHSVHAMSHSKSDASQEKSDEPEEDPYKTLPKNLQQLSRLISGMGFPLSRVARTCKLVGDDQKRIVEHLLAMSELLDLGFSESQVSSALLKCDNDRDRALDLLIL